MSDKPGKKILVVDDDADNLDLLKIILDKGNYDVVTASGGVEALREATNAFFGVILLDLRMPGMDGNQVLEKLKEESPQSLVMILSANGSDDNIKKACKADVFDFLEKPIDNNLLLHKVEKAFQHSDTLLKDEQARKETLNRYPYKNIIGSSPQVKKVFKDIEIVAPTDSSVLITGETGTGKELVARAIHARSKRALGPFVAINASALPETLLEAELFGYEKGAFTDAKARKFGYFESCKDGTIFLDEIGEISPRMQVTLLRVLQGKKIIRVGGTEEIPVNARVIAATNKNLEKLVEEGSFRQDLFYRIHVVNIELPPLRERKEDIPLLIDHFIKKYSNKEVNVSDEAMEILMGYDYPGNVRELEHIIEHALIYREGAVIKPENLPLRITNRSHIPGFSEAFKLPWKDAKEMFEKWYIDKKLKETDWNISAAAKISGINRSDLHKKIDKLGIRK